MANTTELRAFRRYGEKKAGVHNKFYEVTAEETEDGGRWAFTWGRIGSKGQSKSGTTYSFESARRTCEDQFEKKASRGYDEVSALEALASCCEELEERETDGLPPAEFDIPEFETGSRKTTRRLRDLAEKYAKKMNIVRASRYDLGIDAYEKQAQAVVKQYKAEFERVRKTKAHGAYVTDLTEGHARVFFQILKDHSNVAVYAWWPPARR